MLTSALLIAATTWALSRVRGDEPISRVQLVLLSLLALAVLVAIALAIRYAMA